MGLLSLWVRTNLLVFLMVLLLFFSNFVFAQDIVERDYHDQTYIVNDLFGDSNVIQNDGLTLKTLFVKVSLIVFVLFVILAVVRIFLARNRFSRVGSIFDEFTQKIAGNLSYLSQGGGLKLKQTLTLAPGQNIYLVEVDEKKLLLGATHHGGVHFLTDLTQISSRNYNLSKHVGILSAKQLDEHDNKDIPFVASTITDSINGSTSNSDLGTNTTIGINVKEPSTNLHGQPLSQPLKRRTNFKQSLLKDG